MGDTDQPSKSAISAPIENSDTSVPEFKPVAMMECDEKRGSVLPSEIPHVGSYSSGLGVGSTDSSERTKTTRRSKYGATATSLASSRSSRSGSGSVASTTTRMTRNGNSHQSIGSETGKTRGSRTDKSNSQASSSQNSSSSSNPNTSENCEEEQPSIRMSNKGAIQFQLPGRIQHKTTIKVTHFPDGSSDSIVLNIPTDNNATEACQSGSNPKPPNQPCVSSSPYPIDYSPEQQALLDPFMYNSYQNANLMQQFAQYPYLQQQQSMSWNGYNYGYPNYQYNNYPYIQNQFQQSGSFSNSYAQFQQNSSRTNPYAQYQQSAASSGQYGNQNMYGYPPC